MCRRRRASNQSSIIGPGETTIPGGLDCRCRPADAWIFTQSVARTPNGPATIELGTNVVQFHFQDRSRGATSNTSLRSRTSAIDNARFTCHRSQALIPHAEPSAGVLYSARRVARASTGCCSTRPRPRRQASTTSVPKTRAARRAGPLAAKKPRPRGASRRRFPTSPNGATTESTQVAERVARVYKQRQAVLRLCLDGVARHSCRPGPRRSAVPAPAAVRVAAEAARRRGQL